MNGFIFNALFTIVPVLIAGVFIFVFAMILSPKFRGRMMARQMKATRYATDFAKEDMTKTTENLADAAIDAASGIIEDKGGQIEDIMNRAVTIKTDVIKKALNDNKDELEGLMETAAQLNAKVKATEAEAVVKAVKNAIMDDGEAGDGDPGEAKIFCKFCGAKIDADSVFCSKCGKEL